VTALEACSLHVDTIRALSAMTAERDSWRLVALATMGYAADLQRELSMVDTREYVHRTRTQDRRDVFLDHRDLREAEAA
jgi:hypothetical protein